MIRILQFIEQIAIGLYFLCALIFLVGVRRFSAARRQLKGSQFELEKELSRYQSRNAQTGIILIVEFALIIFAIANVVVPTLRANPPQFNTVAEVIQDIPFATTSPNDLLAGTPPPNFAAGVEIPGIEDELNLQPFATPTLTPTPVGTIIADVPAVVGCNTDEASLRVPANGMVVHQVTNILGNATTENFAFYRFELNGPATNNSWGFLSEYTTPVRNGELGQLIPSQLTPGEYKFRLVVYDINNTLKASCAITMFISEPILTATPISGN